jgi:hypothetical protein
MKLLFEKANFLSVIASEREAMTDKVMLAMTGCKSNTTACLAKK